MDQLSYERPLGAGFCLGKCNYFDFYGNALPVFDYVEKVKGSINF